MLDDDIGATIKYALQPTLLALYAMVFVGQILRGVHFGWYEASRFSFVSQMIDFVLGIVAFGFDVVGFLLVVVGAVAILHKVVTDVHGGDVLGATDSVGSPDASGIPSSETDSSEDGGASAAGGK